MDNHKQKYYHLVCNDQNLDTSIKNAIELKDNGDYSLLITGLGMQGSLFSHLWPVNPELHWQVAVPWGERMQIPLAPQGPLLKHGSRSSHNWPKKPGEQEHWNPPKLFVLQTPLFKHLRIY